MINDILTLDSKLYNDKNTFEDKFNKLANYILNETVLVVNDISYKICEIEFYLYCKKHKDIFTHRDEDQSIKCKFYFHKRGGTYKSGSFKGMDITFTDSDNKKRVCYGGILIRSIKSVDEDQMIEGPCRVVDSILKVTKKAKIADLVGDELMSVIDNNSLLYLKYDNTFDNERVFTTCRVGLTLKKATNKNSKLMNKYIMTNYRYLTFPKEIKKYKFSLAINLKHEDNDEDEIFNLTGIRQANTKKYHLTAKSGKNSKFADYYGKSLKSSDMCKLQGLWLATYKPKTKLVNIKKSNMIDLGYKNLEEWIANPNNVYIGREVRFKPCTFRSKWYNPYSAKKYGRDKCIELYEEYLKNNKGLMKSLDELKGKTLGCWCSPLGCHGNVLMKYLK